MNRPSKNPIITVKKLLVIPLLIIPVLIFSAETGAQVNTETSNVYEDKYWNSLTYLNIESHPEDDNVAVIKLFLEEDSPVLFQLIINDETVSIADKNLPAGNHVIHYDYSAVEMYDTDFRYTLEIEGDMNVELNGPFIEDGKLRTHNNESFH